VIGSRLFSSLKSLKAGFPGEVVADMFCLLRIELELSMRAKGMLMAREAGLEVPVGSELRARLAELEYLERSIGRTGLLALKPLHVASGRDVWHRYLLEQARGPVA
jgi:protease PrsW